MHAEGWYQDPFELHADRWFSAGRPTALVRDGDQEANDPPPAAEYTGALIDVVVDQPTNGSDLARADDRAARGFELVDGPNAAFDTFGYTDGFGF